jgi:general stress protein 26
MLRGTMEVLQDQPTKDRIWRDGDTMYYSLGVTDPDYCVLKFTAENGRMYENFKSYDFKI